MKNIPKSSESIESRKLFHSGLFSYADSLSESCAATLTTLRALSHKNKVTHIETINIYIIVIVFLETHCFLQSVLYQFLPIRRRQYSGVINNSRTIQIRYRCIRYQPHSSIISRIDIGDLSADVLSRNRNVACFEKERDSILAMHCLIHLSANVLRN